MIREDTPNFKLEIDLERLSPDEQGRAAGVLRRVLEKLGHPATERFKDAV